MHAHTTCAAAPSSVPMNAVNTTAATSSTPAPGSFDDMEPTCTPDRMPLATTSRHTSETAVRAFGTTWISTEGVELHGGWHNVFNGIAGILNIFVMTGWFGIYVSKKKQDMLWPDMTWVFIISYDIWNFCYTYNCLPTHSWYCGLALLLAPPWPACCGTRAAGSKTARTRWRCGACSARCAPCSPTIPSSPCSR